MTCSVTKHAQGVVFAAEKGGLNSGLVERFSFVFVCTKYSFMVELQSAARMSERESKFEVYNSGYNLLQKFSK